MNQPPFGPDPGATQPIPRPAGGAPIRFGNVPLYVFARFLAFAIDVALLGGIAAAFGFHAFERGFLALPGRTEDGFTALVLAAFGSALLFAFLCEALFGATLGKAIFGLRVRRANGGHAGVGRIFLRYLLRPLDVLLVGPILALVTPRHQRLGDFAAGTIVARFRYGPLASIVGIVLLAALAYAQGVFGGGITTLLELGAEAANYGPDIVAKTAAVVGVVLPHEPAGSAQAIASPNAAASPISSDPDASAEPSDESTPESTPSTNDPAQPAPDATSERAGAPSVEHI